MYRFELSGTVNLLFSSQAYLQEIPANCRLDRVHSLSTTFLWQTNIKSLGFHHTYADLWTFSSWSFYRSQFHVLLDLNIFMAAAQVYNYDATTSCGVSRGINKQTVPHHIHIPYYFMISEFLELQNSFPIFFWYIYPKIDENTSSKSQQGILGFFEV